MNSSQLGPLREVVGRAITGDGMPGYELVGVANDLRSGREVRMYQLVLVDKTTYYLAQGLVSADRGPAVVDQFRQVTTSFRRLRPPK